MKRQKKWEEWKNKINFIPTTTPTNYSAAEVPNDSVADTHSIAHTHTHAHKKDKVREAIATIIIIIKHHYQAKIEHRHRTHSHTHAYTQTHILTNRDSSQMHKTRAASYIYIYVRSYVQTAGPFLIIQRYRNCRRRWWSDFIANEIHVYARMCILYFDYSFHLDMPIN